jgi:phosphopantothenoylcysteine decarboxylase/phosphopantothenate--cysteine ligase
MRIIVTAGPTREYIDSVRFITNASSGQMGCAVAEAATRAGHEVTLLLGGCANSVGCADSSRRGRFRREESAHGIPAQADLPKQQDSVCSSQTSSTPYCVVPFVSVQDLKSALEERFDSCDALVMAAAVGDFRPETILPYKLSRRGGPITLKLYPTEDILAGLGQRKRAGQIIVAFAVEDAPPEQIEAKARAEMIEKNADFVVVNTPAAMAADHSHACILSREAVVLPWSDRPKQALAEQIVALLK